MAYTNTPTISTYETKDIPAAYDLDIPTGVLDISLGAGMVNVVPVKNGQTIIGETRYVLSANQPDNSGAAVVTRGMYVWEKTVGTIYYYVVTHSSANVSKVWTSTTGLASSWTAVTTLTNDGTTPVRFSEFIDATNTKKLVMVDGIEGYVFTTNAAGTKIVDADFPTPHVPFPVFMDGYLFLAKANTGDIYNSDLNDPAIWTAGSFISSELYPDDVQALVKINNYICAIGTQGCEFFYDAANPTASPLARIDSAALAFGTPFPNSIAYTKNQVVFLANNNDGSVSLKLIEDLKSTDIRCPFINFLNYAIANGNATAAGLRGMFFRHGNALCYGLAFKGNTSVAGAPSQAPYLVFSFESQMWTEFQGAALATAFPVYFTSPTTSNQLLTYVAGGDGIVWFGTLNPQSTISATSGDVGDITDAAHTSTTVPIQQEIRTTIQDFDSLNLKTASRFGVSYTTSRSEPASANWDVYWADGPSYSWGATGSFASQSSIYSFPFVYQLGSFRQRAFRVRLRPTTGVGAALRWKHFEVEINRGQH